MATVRTGGGILQKAVLVLGLLLVAPYIVNGFLAWLTPLLPTVLITAAVLVALFGVTVLLIRRLRRNAAR